MSTTDEERLRAAWWTCIVEPEDPHAAALRSALGDEEAIRWARAARPGALPGALRALSPKWREAHERWRARIAVADAGRELDAVHRLGGDFLIPGDPEWPAPLEDLGERAPIGIWVLGALPGERAVALVGSRAATAAGSRTATDIAAQLAEEGIAVVSGGAFGIDIAAHRGALALHGRTAAIMAGGLEQPYPQAHIEDFRKILSEGGALVSECPPSWRPAKWRFLSRNRLIAALTRATVVVEAGARSGALATARRAMEMGRPVGAVPGPVSSASSSGCHELIRNGATLVRDGRDAHELAFPFESLEQGALFGEPVEEDRGIAALAPNTRRVYEALPKASRTTLARVTRASGLSEREVVAALAELELCGLVASSTRGWGRRR
ncbi:MAG: DNA-processing protein DprA [Schaalia hyovaginalis]|uniref:DNA-processing protein DprA n=1 Tax=Schaalia hyovaginalis TaxID=29316 RepID=UPI002A90FD5D|nr:DNA-processing protein DprA [Schaalia hyovaginalis]MDY5600348.1 DNA-processing protein DprA [Schaalia hyovaginalis]